MLLNKDSITYYLNNTLGLTDLVLIDYPKTDHLPYLLQDQFKFLQVKFTKCLVTLAIPQKKMPLRQMRDVLKHLSTNIPLVMCFESLTSYERRYLIEQKISFLVPGNQLFLMELGIDLREYFFRKKEAATFELNPATQAMLLWFLQNHPLSSEWSPSEVAPVLQYTSMTASRAVNELVGLGLFEEFSQGRRKYLRTKNTHEEIWHKAKPYLRSPVKQEIWTHDVIKLPGLEIGLAGLSALSNQTMINSDEETCYALSSKDWLEVKQTITVLPEKEPGANCYQIWSYAPRMSREGTNSVGVKCVDKLSLWLSFKGSSDARIELARSELEESFRW
jgi:DNA-binding MarR family transcriptional regulator